MTDNEDNCKFVFFPNLENKTNRWRNILVVDELVEDSDEENGRRSSSTLNNYSILPPIKSGTHENSPQPPYFIKQLQQKYQQENDPTSEMSTDAKLDDAYLKMKRLDKALEEAFEKEKQVKYETISLMKKYFH